MRVIELHQTLTALIDGAVSDTSDIAVEEVSIDAPIIVRLAHGPDGPLVVAHPPWSAYRAGIEPRVHRTTVSAVSLPTGAVDDTKTDNSSTREQTTVTVRPPME